MITILIGTRYSLIMNSINAKCLRQHLLFQLITKLSFVHRKE